MATTTKRKPSLVDNLTDQDAHAVLRLLENAAQHQEGFIVWLADIIDPANIPEAAELLMKKQRGEALALLSEAAREKFTYAAIDNGESDENITIIVDGERVYCPPASIAHQIRTAEKLYEAARDDGRPYMPCHHLPEPNEAKTNGRKRRGGK